MNTPRTFRVTLELTDADFGAIVGTLTDAAARCNAVGFVRTAAKLKTLAVKFRLACCDAEIARIMGSEVPTPSCNIVRSR